MDNQDDPKSFVPALSKHWFLIVFFGGMILTWGRFEMKVAYLESRQEALELSQKDTTATIVSMSGDIREIKTTLQFIKERVR